ncbi:four-carbon acid sugar kinase family protein [Sulfobacillus harzensis]|uniref:Four-carbon acid sugar kinase family protein n=1 Tax=Sulfobacillus harzensis TaxID=2729629 RepID=A0A7Y0Q1E7_9FIRM|nr:four-carbon acid sugar kinase family protein [Sulfobacillus harzensis]NMP21377.1 four-carbon acid sugar kinase family protein [Sulfobacillus harzensis]
MIAVWADDLSGALDTAIVFQHHQRTRVFPEIPLSLPRSADVAVIHIESRHVSPEGIAGRFRTIPAALLSADHHYLKVDSTLRGPVGAMVDAFLDALPRYRGAVICPAFPQNHRTVLNGRLFVEGRPAHRTELAHDPKNPVATDDIATMLAPLTNRPIIALRSTALENSKDVGGIFIADAVSMEDLQRLAALVAANPHLLPVGSAGWAAPLARQWATDAPPPETKRPCFDRIVAVVGSRHPASRRQVDQVRQNPEWEIHENPDIPPATAKHHIFVTPSETQSNPDADLNRFAHAVKAILLQPSARTVVVSTGGDTTLALVRHLRIKALTPLEELEPGVVLSQSGGRVPIHLVTKSGAFGTPDFFPELAHKLSVPGDAQHSTTYTVSNDTSIRGDY